VKGWTGKRFIHANETRLLLHRQYFCANLYICICMYVCTRVTGLGEIWPPGRLFTLGTFLKITKVGQTFVLLSFTNWVT
jgi:hypothetical protein